MNVNIDKMLKEQEALLTKINQQPVERESYETTCYHDIEKVITKTNIIEKCGQVILTRYIGNHIYKVEFKLDVKVTEIIPWLTIGDGMFVRGSSNGRYIDL